MKTPRPLFLAIAVTLSCSLETASAQNQKQNQELEALKAAVQQMQQTIQEQNAKIADLERKISNSPPAAPETVTTMSVTNQSGTNLIVVHADQEENRYDMEDRQEPAARARDLTLEPDYKGFLTVPNMPFLLKFDPRPRVDVITDNRNPGNTRRFVTAQIPVQGTPEYGHGEQFNMNANGSQLRAELVAPEIDGSPRIYYQNDFFGSETADMRFRLMHLYGEYYDFVGGYTYGVFEDPDGWPNTVDYEGPNAVVFARRPVLQYKLPLNDNWKMTFGVENPAISLNANPPATNSTLNARMPDLGFNVRWEQDKVGHVQFSTLFRDIGSADPSFGQQSVLGWGVNLSVGFNFTKKDYLQLWGVRGDGIGSMGNDTSFVDGSDAAFTSTGKLQALRYYSGLIGYTHRWTEKWNSTVTFGYVNLQDISSLPPDFFHTSRYGSINLMYQLHSRVSVGLETLYGFHGIHDGSSGELIRVQLGLVYSLF